MSGSQETSRQAGAAGILGMAGEDVKSSGHAGTPDVNVRGCEPADGRQRGRTSSAPPEVITSSDVYTGARSLMADFVGSTESGGCKQNIDIGNGRMVMDVDRSNFFEVDEQGAEDFLFWEIMESRVHERPEAADPGQAFRHYQMLGTFSTARRHLAEQDYMLRRADWKRRHGVFAMTNAQLIARSVTDAQRAAGLRCPPGTTTLPEDYAAKLDAEHARRTAGRWRPAAEVATVAA